MDKLLILFLFTILIFPVSVFSQSKKMSDKKANKEKADLLIVGGKIVTMDAEMRVIEDGAIVVSGGAIKAIGERDEITKNYTAKQTINADGKIIIPGLINTHTHIPMTLFRGIADDLDLEEWLNKYIFPAEKENVNEDFVRVGTRLGLAEMIRGGTTTFCDMYYFEDAVADETYKAGMRGVLGETIIDFPVADNKTNEEAMKYAETFVKKWQNNPLITPAIAPHAPYTVSQEHLEAIKKLSDKLNAPVVIHVAETQKEVNDMKAKNGMRVIEYLDKIGFLNEKTIAAHVVFPDKSELETLKTRKVGIAHNPQSNMKLASGVAPVPEMLKMNLPVGLGTDGAASNNDLDLWEEMDTAAKLHKVFSGDPKVLTAQEAFTMATIGGARALHLEDKIGSLEVGKRADILIVNFDTLHQTPVYNVYSHLVYATKSSNVRTVIVDGKVLMLDYKLLTLDENSIKKDATAYHRQIINNLSKQ